VTTVGLAPGADVHTTAGHAYAFDARVKLTHTKADLFSLAAAHGLRVASYGEGPPEGSYRRVVAFTLAVGPSVLPWSLPWPASMFDGSSLTAATEEDTPNPAAVAALLQTPTTSANLSTAAVPPSSRGSSSRSWATPVAGAALAVGVALAFDAETGGSWARRLFGRGRRRRRREPTARTSPRTRRSATARARLAPARR
jgi:hypothetical protein